MIPGDWAYFDNVSHTNNPDNWTFGLEGENVIMVGTQGGRDLYWGHFGDDNTILTQEGWERNWYDDPNIRGKDGEYPMLMPFLERVNFPTEGLVTK